MPRPQKKPRTFSQEYLLEPLEGDDSFATKRMFGGLAVYLGGLMVAFLCEEPELKPEKRVWHGLLFPVEREHHVSLMREWPALVQHSVLPKWLYLRLDDASYESCASELVERIRRRDPRLGIEPRERRKRRSPARPSKRGR